MSEQDSGYKTMTEIAVDVIKKHILDGTYPPNSRLIPAHMEKELNLGRVAIREALQVLVGTGLLLAIPNKGVIVSRCLNFEEMKQIYDIKVFLEGKAFELSASRINDEEIAYLEELNQEMTNRPLGSKDYFELNRKFHMALYKISNLDFLCQLISQIQDRIFLFRSVFPFENQEMINYVNQHSKILKALKAHNVREAQKEMKKHLREGYNRMIKQNYQQKCELEKNSRTAQQSFGSRKVTV